MMIVKPQLLTSAWIFSSSQNSGRASARQHAVVGDQMSRGPARSVAIAVWGP
jgi:hypothetical protein